MADETLQLEIQVSLCQASEMKIKEIAEDLKLEIGEKRKTTVVNMICQRIEEDLKDIDGEERISYLKGICSRHFKDHKVKETNESQPPPVSDDKEQTEQTTLKTMLETTSVLRRQFKIVGQIGNPDQKDKLSFTSLTRQMGTGLEQGYKEQEIVDGVIRAIGAGMVLRSYLETYKDLSLDRLKKILHNHYGVKNSTELYQSLASICQGPKETPQEFLMRALELRQKILFSSDHNEGEDTLVYEADHIQKLFLRTVETGLQDENVRVKLRSYLKEPKVSDEELIKQVNTAVSAENERARKLRSQNRNKSAQVAQVGKERGVAQQESATEKKENQSKDELLVTLQAIKSEVAQLKNKWRVSNQDTEQTHSQVEEAPTQEQPDNRRNRDRKSPPRCSSCQENKKDRCSHCFLCGSDNHYAIGCRQHRENRALNYNRLLPRGRK